MLLRDKLQKIEQRGRLIASRQFDRTENGDWATLIDGVVRPMVERHLRSRSAKRLVRERIRRAVGPGRSGILTWSQAYIEAWRDLNASLRDETTESSRAASRAKVEIGSLAKGLELVLEAHRQAASLLRWGVREIWIPHQWAVSRAVSYEYSAARQYFDMAEVS